MVLFSESHHIPQIYNPDTPQPTYRHISVIPFFCFFPHYHTSATTWKQKGTKPKIENIRKIAKYLEVPEEYFTEDSEKITNSNSIIGNQNAGDNTITVTHQENSAIDEMEKELLIRFRKLKIDNKIKSFNFISELAKQESNR